MKNQALVLKIKVPGCVLDPSPENKEPANFGVKSQAMRNCPPNSNILFCGCGVDCDKNHLRPFHILLFTKSKIWALCNSDLPGLIQTECDLKTTTNQTKATLWLPSKSDGKMII